MPVQIALARFWEQGSNLLGNYPYWYEGTTPYRYLTGPVLPFILTSLHRFAGDWFFLMLAVIGFFWLLGSLGVYLLTRALSGSKKQSLLASLFYGFGWIVPLLFRFSDGLSLISFSLLPFVFLIYLKKANLLLSLAIALVLLLDASALGTMSLGLMMILILGGWQRIEERGKKLLGLIALGIGLATIWYTPGYWLTLLRSPSFGGRPLAGVVFWLGKLLPTALALIAAIVSVRFFKAKDRLRDLAFLWLAVFGLLTLLRFLSDPDFWLDWSAYGLELQLGIGLWLSWGLGHKAKSLVIAMLLIQIVIFGVIFNYFVGKCIRNNLDYSLEYTLGQELQKRVKSEERVFLSGTTSFWLNAFFEIKQVRGGNDPASLGKNWRGLAWEIREGEDGRKSVELLRQNHISWLVVHTPESKEYWQDFKYPQKFESLEGLEKVFDQVGDRIYYVLED